MPMPGLAILLAKKPMDKSDKMDKPMDDEMPEEHSKDETQRAVMKAFIDAVHDKDVDGSLQAYKDLSELCSDDGEGGDDGSY